jgi:hypothetical protein
MRSSILVAAICLASLIGCATCPTTPPSTLARMQALPQTSEMRHLLEADECDMRWQRAQVWLGRHSPWKLQLETEVVLDSYDPLRTGEAKYGFRVFLEPKPDAKCYIDFQVIWDYEGSCEASPPPDLVARAFYHYIDTGEDVIYGPVPFYGSSMRLSYFGGPLERRLNVQEPTGKNPK